MTRYRRVEVGTWHDRQFCELTPATPNGQTLWLYLLCGRRTTVFPGLITATLSLIASDLGWPLEHATPSLRTVWEEISDRDMARADWQAGLVVLPKSLLVRGVPRETSRPGSPNTFAGWAKAWGDIPECDLKDWYLLELGTFAAALDELVVAERGGRQAKQTYHSVYLNAFATSLGRVPGVVRDSYRYSFETHARAGDARARDPDPVPVPVLLDQDLPSGIGIPSKGGRGGDLIRGQDDPAVLERRRLIGVFVERVNRARIDLSAELGLSGVRPIALMGEGERALMQRLKESADPAADMDHVIEVAIAEARRPPCELRWLGWSLAEPKAWRTKLATTPAEARRAPRGSNGSVFSALDRAAEDLKQRGVVIADAGRDDDHDD